MSASLADVVSAPDEEDHAAGTPTIPIFLPDVPPFGTGQALDLLLRELDTERRLGEIGFSRPIPVADCEVLLAAG